MDDATDTGLYGFQEWAKENIGLEYWADVDEEEDNYSENSFP